MKPDKIQLIGGVVDIFQFKLAFQCMIAIIEGDIDIVIYFLLPVILLATGHKSGEGY
jgi:hypothetical protein